MTLLTYRIETLGCKANLYDSQRLAEALEALGFRRSQDGAPADVCILNTCTVTAVADRKGRQLAARLARRNLGARLFVTGCGVATDRERLAAVEGVEAVFAELVLTGIHLGLYGRDRPGGEGLAGLVRALAAVPGLGRLRLSSVEAAEVDEDLPDAMQHPAVCPHLHIPLQSGDADVLRRMNRHYGPEEFLRAVELARARLDRPALTTDVIVGFPGETDAAFENTLALCRAARFSRLHVFPFSPRPGTPAAGDSSPHVIEPASRLGYR